MLFRSATDAVVVILILFVVLGLAISALDDVDKNKAKGKWLAIISIAMSSVGIIGLGVWFLFAILLR